MRKLVANMKSTRRAHWAGCSCTAFLVLVLSSVCGAHESGAASFAIEVDKPFEEVVAVVDEVAHSSVIKGTFEYRDEEQLTGAEFAQNQRLFPAWSGAGKVFYKMRRKVLSPAHFVNSNDVGTVAVRYVVQPAGATSTRLIVDAVFVENARHHWHASDGYVETCEFAEIGRRLQEYEELRSAPARGAPFSTSRESSLSGNRVPGKEHATVDVNDNKTLDLQRVVAEQKVKLEAEQAELQQLEAQVRQLRKAEYVRVSAEGAELRILPYGHARVVEALKRGEEVTILAKIHTWYQVRSEDGQQGWVTHTFLEAQP